MTLAVVRDTVTESRFEMTLHPRMEIYFHSARCNGTRMDSVAICGFRFLCLCLFRFLTHVLLVVSRLLFTERATKARQLTERTKRYAKDQ
ncbi:MAG: hypothetical protein ACI9G1_000713 [Pirellulaceae bacterium]|jgi:hypothetical protein